MSGRKRFRPLTGQPEFSFGAWRHFDFAPQVGDTATTGRAGAVLLAAENPRAQAVLDFEFRRVDPRRVTRLQPAGLIDGSQPRG